MLKNKSLKVYLALIFAMLFWGFSFIWTKEVFKFYNPLTTILFRLIISSVFLLVLNLYFKKLIIIKGKDLWNLILLSFLQPFLYFIGENYGLSYVSSTVTAVIIATIPLFSPFAAWYFLKEKITLMNFAGIVLSIIGVLLVIMTDDYNLEADPVGIAFLSLAVTSAIAYSIVIIKLSKRYDVYNLITYQNAIGVLWFIPAFLLIDLNDFIKVGFKSEPFIPIMQLAIFASSGSYLLFTYGLKNLGITKANTFTNIIPVFTAFFAWILLGETLSVINIIGIIVVVTGLFFTQIKHNTLVRTKIFFTKWFKD